VIINVGSNTNPPVPPASNLSIVVLAVEPVLATALKIDRHGGRTLVLCAAVASGQPRLGAFHVYNKNGVSSSLSAASVKSFWNKGFSQILPVPIISLELLLDSVPQGIDVVHLKTDMQGYDFDAIKSAGKRLREIPTIFSEVYCRGQSKYEGVKNDLQLDWVQYMDEMGFTLSNRRGLEQKKFYVTPPVSSRTTGDCETDAAWERNETWRSIDHFVDRTTSVSKATVRSLIDFPPGTKGVIINVGSNTNPPVPPASNLSIVVLAVEPVLATALKIDRHGGRTLVLCAAVASGQPRLGAFHVYNKNGVSSSLSAASVKSFWNKGFSQILPVPIISLELLLDSVPQGIDVVHLKTDMQGYDFDAIKSAGKRLREIPTIFSEVYCRGQSKYEGVKNDLQLDWVQYMDEMGFTLSNRRGLEQKKFYVTPPVSSRTTGDCETDAAWERAGP